MNKLIKYMYAGMFAVLSAVPAFAGDIIISEIHYNPLPEGTLSGDYYEFLELKNTSEAAIDISGYKFVNGITYTIPAGSVIEGGGYYILSRSKIYFNSRYGMQANAEYITTKLSNSGESLVLVNTANDTIIKLSYGTKFPWPALANGLGFSLVPVNESADLSQTKNWRNSAEIGGSPGKADPVQTYKTVYISEILANSVVPAVDTIELFNPNTEDIDISGWKLSDKLTLPLSYTFPAGTVIKGNSYLVLAQGQIGADGLVSAGNPLDFGFGLSSTGENIYIFSTTDGNLNGFSDGFSFGPSHEGQSFSRLVNSEGRLLYEETATSFGTANVNPIPKLLVFEEILYAPALGQYEYLKIKNISGQSVDITNWDISGISITKAQFTGQIAADESFYAVENAITPEDFRTAMGIAASVKILNFAGALKNEGEEIALKQPTNALDTLAPYYIVEAVRYDNKAPWPIEAANGKALIRKNLHTFGNEPTNWKTSALTLPIAVITGAKSAELNQIVSYSAANSNEPNGKTLSYKWTVTTASGTVVATGTEPDIQFTTTEQGVYAIRLTVSNGTEESFPMIYSLTVLQTGDNVLEASSPIVFPTLTDDLITIQTSGEEFNYSIQSISGSTILEGKVTEKLSSISLKSATLGSGWLLITLSDSKNTYVQKVFYTDK